VHLSLPWGLAVGPWPHIPPPIKLRYRVGPAIEVPQDLSPDEEPPDDLVRDLDATVQRAVQSLLDELKREA